MRAQLPITITSWNIQGVKDKLESQWICNVMQNNSFILLSETKTSELPRLSGFKTINNPSKTSRRGGVAVLIKNCIFENIVKIDKSYEGVIHFEMSNLPFVTFVLCYIAPDDSPYYDKAVFGHLHSILNEKKENVYIIFGDLNARISTPDLTSVSPSLRYPTCQDDRINHNGRLLVNLCKDNQMVIVNNLCTDEKQFVSNLSYRKGLRWVSELDYCVVSLKGLKYVESLDMMQTLDGSKIPSDHAMLKVCLEFSGCSVPSEMLRCRAEDLGRSVYETDEQIVLRKSTKMSNVNGEGVKTYLRSNLPPSIDDIPENELPNVFFEEAEKIMKLNRCRRDENTIPFVSNRWKRILELNDSRLIWKAIGWNGELAEESSQMPNDIEFKIHFEQLLNPPGVEEPDMIDSGVDVPSLDDEIVPGEVKLAINSMNANKAYIGVDAGFLKLLPMSWIVWLTTLFNRVFIFGTYPLLWCISKLIILFKKGLRYLCGNYRGITITDTLAKLYDKVLYNRLKAWIKIDKCQAGGQEKRGCEEQRMALRLLIDYAKCKNKKLFICFIDFSKAYDRISRPKLFRLLANLGCGRIMLRALQAMYKSTKNILKTAIINSKIGIKQGGSSSGLLFILYMDALAKMIKDACPDDDYLGSIHSLMLMDDTALLATSRETLLKRYDALVRFCEEYDMVINEDKTKFMVINGNRVDRESFHKGGLIINHVDSYIYLGSPFSANGSILTDIQEHANLKQKHANKFNTFCFKNQSMPFVFKKTVFDAVLTTKLIYGCESWFTKDYKSIEVSYMSALKALLGVRKQTPNRVVLTECGVTELKDVVRKHQQNFINSKFNDPEEPLTKVFELCQQNDTTAYRYIQQTKEYVFDAMERRIESMRSSTKTKTKTYMTINPSCSVHCMYTSTDTYVADYRRIEVTRCRVRSHRLKGVGYHQILDCVRVVQMRCRMRPTWYIVVDLQMI